MSRLYKGILFNSATVAALCGPLADAVRERRIRTAVVSNHNRREVTERLAARGLAFDVVVGGYDLSRWGEYRKPLPDLLFVAAAKLGLDPEEVLCVSDCPRDGQAACAAGMDCVPYDPAGMDALVQRLGQNQPAGAPRDFSGIAAPLTGLMGVVVGDVAGLSVLLADDVITTGSSVRACANALLERGAREVSVCALARVW